MTIKATQGKQGRAKKPDEKLTWLLQPNESMFFVWPDLIETERELCWTVETHTPEIANKSNSIKIDSSGIHSVEFDVEASHDDSNAECKTYLILPFITKKTHFTLSLS